MPKQAVKLIGLSVIVAAALPLAGCDVDLNYLLSSALEQSAMSRRSVPLEDAIAGGKLTEEEVAKLELILEVREYARDVIGLDVGRNYERFYDSGGEAVAFNVSASPKDAFEPYIWRVPVVGVVPGLGFLDRVLAEREAQELADAGLDVFMYEVDAYSLLGFTSDLVLAPMLERSNISIAGTIFHELLHGTIWRRGDADFDESLATFVGRTAAMEFFAVRYPEQPELVQQAAEYFEDGDYFADAMLVLYEELAAYYGRTDLSSAEKIEGRQAVFDAGGVRFNDEVLPAMNHAERYEWATSITANNAWMLAIRRYHLDLEVFGQVHEATGGDWEATLSLFSAAARSSDPYGYLRAWLADGEVE